MSATHYARDGQVIIDVDEPGHGRLTLVLHDDTGEVRYHELAGGALGLLLAEMTTAALDGLPADLSAARTPGLRGHLDAMLTREVLPGLQGMILLAAAGTDRYERIHADEDAPTEPLCVDCNLGSPYHQAVTISERCLDHGHSPFGVRGQR